MSFPAQAEFPFASLDFPGRTTLAVKEVAERIGVSSRQVTYWIQDGTLQAVDVCRDIAISIRQSPRVPIEAYRAFITARLTNPNTCFETLQTLPNKALVDLQAELEAILQEKGLLECV